MLDTERPPGAGSEHWTRSAVLDAFDGWQKQEPDRASVLDAEALAYVEYHARRYARLLEAVQWASAAALESGPLHVLDVGPNVQTALLRRALPSAVVDTLGFAHPAVPPRSGEVHIPFDLNDATYPDRWPALTHDYDVIVVAEVVEHLHVPAAAVLDARALGLRPPGSLCFRRPTRRLCTSALRSCAAATRQSRRGHVERIRATFTSTRWPNSLSSSALPASRWNG